MDSTNKNLTAQESLEIITSMISQAKGNAKDNSIYFLLWGWVVVIANLISFGLIQVHYNMPFLAWLIVIPAWAATIYIGWKGSQTKRVHTHLDRITTALWLAFSVVAFSIIFFGFKINYQINPLILLFLSIPTFISGIILRFKPLKVGGILFWLFGIINFLVPMEYQNLIGALAIVCGYLVPGYMLKGQSKQ